MSYAVIAHNVRHFAENHPNLDDNLHVMAVDAIMLLMEHMDENHALPYLDNVIAALRCGLWDAAPLLLATAMASIADELASDLEFAEKRAVARHH